MIPPTPSFHRSPLHIIASGGAELIGLVLIAYAVYFVPQKMAGTAAPLMGYLVFLAVLGLGSMAGGIGYWRNEKWGWYVHLASAIGQLFLPGLLFEFKWDLYHLTGWVCPVVSLAIAELMNIWFRKERVQTGLNIKT